MRVAFVVQRYGVEVAGGAEALCRRTARALSDAGHEVVVHTTTARDYLTWAPHYAAGDELDGPVHVVRYPVETPDPQRAAALARTLGLRPGTAGEESAWALAQGPVSRSLVDAVSRDSAAVVVCWTYLYATTQLTIPLVRRRSVLVPLAHDEPMLRFDLTRGVVHSAGGFAFVTPEERTLVDQRFGVGERPDAIVGTGLDTPSIGDPRRARGAWALPERFALYVGRVDQAKGVDALVRHHAAYRALGGELGLVLAGRAVGNLRLPEWVVQTGFVDDTARSDLLAASEVLVIGSRYESLSLVLLEAWQAARPTLALASAAVLAGQTARAGGGLVYSDEGTYARQLERLAKDPNLRADLASAGLAFTRALTWDACALRWEGLLQSVAA